MNAVYLPAIRLANVLLSSFWLTRGLELIGLLLVAVAAVIYHRVLSGKMKNQKAELERQIHERNELLSYAKLNEQKARKEAEMTYRNKTVLISKISHEIRTPMNAMMGMASLLNETNLTREQREYTATIQNSGESLLNVINEILMNDILEYSKVESGNELESKDLDLRNNIEEVLDLFAMKAAKANLELVYDIDNNVPPQIVGDAFRLRQILMNLVENTFRFTTSGEIFIGVKCVENRDNNRLKLQFEVRDSGIGMAPERLAQVSQELAQSDTSANNGALGLTLIICKRLVNLMGGSIKVDSKENEGSTFRFTIWTRRSQQSTRSQTYAEMAGLEGKRILIVDENVTAADAMKKRLKQWNLSATTATTGKQGLEMLRLDGGFELVITNSNMSQMDGLQFTQYLKQLHPDLPVILLNKPGDETFRPHSGLFDGVINKPVRQHELSKQLFSALRIHNGGLHTDDHNYKQKLSVEFSKQYPLSILIGEDDKMNQKFAMKILNKLGYQAHIANNGQEVLEMVSQRNYDVILMDVQMPVMNGLEATKMIRVCLADQPFIVAMTANTLQGDREECMKAGMDDYISKPINLKDLVIVLERCSLQTRQSNK